MKSIPSLAAAISVALFSNFATPLPASANSTSACSTISTDPNYDPKCSNRCNLNDYFQFIFAVASRPHECTNIPTAFWQYQTQVGEVASSGKNAGGGATAAGSSAAFSSNGTGNGALTLTPSQSIASGAVLLGYASTLGGEEGSKAISSEMPLANEDAQSSAPALEKAIWVKALGSLGSKNATSELASVQIEAGGVMLGTDLFSTQNVRVGVLGAVNDVSVRINENNNKLDLLAVQGGVSATIELGKWYLDGLGTYGVEQNETSRSVDVDGNGDLRYYSSKYTNHRINSAFETGFRITHGRMVIQPLAGVSVNWLKQAAVMEQGNQDAAILTAKNTIMTGSTKLGVNLSTAFIAGDISFVPMIGAYWGHRFGELSNANRISTDLGSSYEFVGSKPPLDVANIYASLMANVSADVALSASYYASFNAQERNHTANVGLRVRF